MEPTRYVVVEGTVETNISLPLIPLWSTRLVAPLIPCNHTSLLKWLNKRKAEYPAVYKRTQQGNKQRLLTTEECLQVREAMLFGPGLHKVLRKGQAIPIKHPPNQNADYYPVPPIEPA